MVALRRIVELYDRAKTRAEQFYTPRELRAMMAFVLLGLVIVAVRGGRSLMEHSGAESDRTPAERAAEHARDSLFFALSREAHRQDSLFFSLPEDSLRLTPSARAARTAHRSPKTDGLRLGSISLNRGTVEELTRLPGVGPATAERILAYREERGRFRTLDELRNVHGFGEAHLSRVRRFLRLD